jgi:hypothetical protein
MLLRNISADQSPWWNQGTPLAAASLVGHLTAAETGGRKYLSPLCYTLDSSFIHLTLIILTSLFEF